MSTPPCRCGCGRPRVRSLYGKVQDWATQECIPRLPPREDTISARLDAIVGEDKPLPTVPARCPRCLGPGKQSVLQVGLTLRQTVIKCQAFDRRGGPCQPTITNEENPPPERLCRAEQRPDTYRDETGRICHRGWFNQPKPEPTTTPNTREENTPMPTCTEKGCQKPADTTIFPFNLCEEHHLELALEAAADVASFHAEMRDKAQATEALASAEIDEPGPGKATTRLLCAAAGCKKPVTHPRKFCSRSCANRTSNAARKEAANADILRRIAESPVLNPRPEQPTDCPAEPVIPDLPAARELAERILAEGVRSERYGAVYVGPEKRTGCWAIGEDGRGHTIEVPWTPTLRLGDEVVVNGVNVKVTRVEAAFQLGDPGPGAQWVPTEAEAWATFEKTGELPFSHEGIEKAKAEIERGEVFPPKDALADLRQKHDMPPPSEQLQLRLRDPQRWRMERRRLDFAGHDVSDALHALRALPNDGVRKAVCDLACEMPPLPEVG